MNKDNFCIAPFVHMYVHSDQGHRLCCRTSEFREVNKNNDETEMDIETRWSNDYYKKAREKLLSGERLSICNDCYSKEEAGGTSDRIRYNRNYADKIIPNIDTGNQFNKPIDLDIRPSNLCNLKCRMCDPSNSSQIEKEFKTHYTRFKPLIDKFMPMGIDVNHEPWLNKNNIEFLLNDNVQKVKILGGEPSIMPETEDILDYLIENNMTDIHVHITTNLTNSNKKFINKLSKLSNVNFNFSIDGTGSVVEYIRSPVKWDSINQNIRTYKDIGFGEIICTFQVYNLFNMIDMLNWAKQLDTPIYFNSLESPTWAHITVIPKHIRDPELLKILDMLDGDDEYTKKNRAVVNQYLAFDETSDPTFFIAATKALDNVREQKLEDSIPEIWDIFKDYYDRMPL